MNPKLLLTSLIWLLITSCTTVHELADKTIDSLQLREIMGEPSSLMLSADVLELNDELRSYVDTHVDTHVDRHWKRATTSWQYAR